MSVFNVTASTSVVLINTASGAGTYTVNFPNLSTIGRIITVRDNDGYASTGNAIVLTPVQGASFGSVTGSLTINQPFGFVTMNTLANGLYNILNTFAFPAGQAAANVSNLNAQVVTIQSTLQFVDRTDATLDTLYVSSSQLIFNNDYVGDVTTPDLQSTVNGLGTAGYLSSFSWNFVLPPTWIAVGGAPQASSIQYSLNGLDWSNGRGANAFNTQGWGAAWNSGIYVAVGNDDDGLNTPSYGFNKYSFDGSNWNNSLAPLLSTPSMSRFGTLYANGYFHSVGKGGSSGGPYSILWSTDGRSWNPSQGSPFNSAGSYARGIAYGNGVWVCAGRADGNAQNSLLWSTDGSNWNPAATPAWNGSNGVTDVAFAGTKFIALCKNGNLATSSNICMSTDGSNWTSPNPASNYGNFGNAMYRIAGDGNSKWVLTTSIAGQPIYYSLDDGTTWQTSPTFSNGSVTATDSKPYWDGLKWWVGLTTGGPFDVVQSIQYSTDAINWSPVTTSQFTGGAAAYGFTSSDGFSNIGFLLTSTVIGLETGFSTSNLNVSSISSGFITAQSIVAESMTISSLFVNVFTVSTTIEEVAINSTIIVNRGYIDNLSTNNVSANKVFISSLGINTANPQVPLDVNGLAWMRSTLYVGSSSNTNQLRFYGTSGDGLSNFNHTVIAENIYSGMEQSELVLFKGNDKVIGPGNGPDRVRVLAAGGFQVDAGVGGTPMIWPEGAPPPTAPFSNCLVVSGSNGGVGIGTSTPQVALDVIGPAIVTTGNMNSICIGQSTITNGATLTWNTIESGIGNLEIASGRGSGVSGFINFYTNIAPGANPASSNKVMTIASTSVGIGTSNPQYALDVNGSAWTRSTLYVGSSPSTNTIRFYGTNNDNQTLFTHTVIGERVYSGDERSELLLFKANDSNSTSGPDRVRVLASGGFFVESCGAPGITGWPEGGNPPVAAISNCLVVNGETGFVGIGTSTPSVALDVIGNVWARSTLYVGSNTSNSQIRFYGTVGDDDTKFTNTVIAEYFYGGSQKSELLLFKGNDSNLSNIGPDRVRVLAAGGFQVDCTGSDSSWPEGSPPPTAAFSNCLVVSGSNGFVGLGTSTPQVVLDVDGSAANSINMRLYRPTSGANNGVGTFYSLQNSAGSECNYASIYGGIRTNAAGSEVGYITLNTQYPGNIIRDSGDPFSNTMVLTASTVGINFPNGTYPGYALDVNGQVWVRSTLLVGSSSTQNQIRFYGTTNDGQGEFSYTVIGERYYQADEKSELLIFKGNDGGGGLTGPDRVRILTTGSFSVDTTTDYNNAYWPQGGSPPPPTYSNCIYVEGSNGRVGINTNAPTVALEVNGAILASGDITAGSDMRFKRNIVTIENPLSTLKELRGVNYYPVNSDVRKIGVIAQEIEKALPEVVLTDDTDNHYKSVSYGNISALLIEAVKELSAKVDKLSGAR
jgi:hypothetical protein